MSLDDRLRDTVAVSVCPRRSVRSAFGLRDGAARIVSGRSGRSDRCGLWGTINNVGSSVDRSRRFALPFWHGPVVCVCCPLIASGMRMMDPEPDGMTLSEEDRRLVGLWAADCAERVLPLFQAKAPSPVRARQSRAPGPSRSGAGGQGNCALLPGRLTQPHARSAIRLPQPPLASRPTQRRPLTSTH